METDNSNSKKYKKPNLGLRDQFLIGAKNVFGLDLRSLAVFRIALGIVLLADLVFRSTTLVEMYTRDGFYTREVSFDYYQNVYGPGWESVLWSVHWISDSPSFQIALFMLAGAFAVLLLAGKWTRLATLVSWVLLVSLHIRNPVVLSSGDFLLKMMLFWSFFLPLGSIWSLDARKRKRLGKPIPNTQRRVVSFATAGFVVQLFAMYFFTGLAKWNEGWWTGDAMYHALGLEIYVTEFGRMLLEYPVALKFVTTGTIFAEVFLIWTLFVPEHNDRYRVLNLIVFWGFHIGIALSMSIGLFPLICIIAWLPMIPSRFWNWLTPSRSTSANQLSETNEGLAPGILGQAFCAVMILFVLAWNVANIQWKPLDKIRLAPFGVLGYAMRVDQHFQMFGDPPKTTPWFVYEAVLDDGTEVDLLSGSAVDFEKPDSWLTLLPSFHWRKLHRNLVAPFRECLREPLADYMVRKWNKEHEPQVARMRMIYFEEDTGPKSIESHNRHSKVWAVVKNEQTSPGSLFDQLIDENKKDGLNLGF